MRIRSSAKQHNATFADQLLTPGNRKIPVDSKTGSITFHFCTLVESTDEFISKVFAYLHENFNKHNWISERAILALKNASVNKIYLRIQSFLPGNGKSYLSMDSIVDLSEAINYPPEFLNPFYPEGCPPHVLHLKVGAAIILLQNLESPKLCNGTLLIVKALCSNLMEATILTGCGKGKSVYIPRAPIMVEWVFNKAGFH